MFIFQLLFLLTPSLTYPLICLTYLYLLRQKREGIKRLMGGEELKLYFKAYGEINEEKLFESFFITRAYIFPIFLNMITVFIVTMAFMLDQKIISPVFFLVDLWQPSLPLTTIAGVAGAYLWSHYDMIRRFSIIDLSPILFYQSWLRLLVCGILGYLIGLSLISPIDLIVAFGIGAFPNDAILSFIRSKTREHLNFSMETTASETPNLHFLQGTTANVIERLNEENIFSAQQLALANPIRLLMRTSLEWTVILDLIDQAFLYIYVGDKISSVREAGIRCALDLCGIKRYAESPDSAKRQIGEQLMQVLAVKLGYDLACVKFMIQLADKDPQLEFIWNLWSEAFSTPPEDLVEQEPVDDSLVPQI